MSTALVMVLELGKNSRLLSVPKTYSLPDSLISVKHCIILIGLGRNELSYMCYFIITYIYSKLRQFYIILKITLNSPKILFLTMITCTVLEENIYGSCT